MVFRIFNLVFFLLLASPALADKKIDCLVAQSGCPIYTDQQPGCQCSAVLLGGGNVGYSCCCQSRDRGIELNRDMWDRLWGRK